MPEPKKNGGSQPQGARWATLAGVLLAALLLAWAILSLLQRDGQTPGFLANTLRKGEIISLMRIDLLRAVEAEKSAVLADTDAASIEFADLARQAVEAVETHRQEMQALLRTESNTEDAKLAQEFGLAWEDFRRVDKTLLDLAVQNTNLKAAGLSHGEGRQAMEDFELALERLMETQAADPHALAINRLAFGAVTSGLKILALQPAHIDEPSDQRMNQMETEIRELEERALEALSALKSLVSPNGQEALAAARQAFQRFEEVTREVIRLSRVNSNLKSLELSLGQKRKVAAQCQEILSIWQEAIGNRASKGSR